MTIGQKIKELRKERELKQYELAEKIGATKGAISIWESEKYEPSLFNCVVLADFFNVSLDELCCRDFKK